MSSVIVLKEPALLQEACTRARTDGEAVGFVPTMGALHEGHAALVRAAKERAPFVVVTVFVNPTQFGPNEDLGAYPRDEAGDVAKLESVGCDLLFAPDVAEMYPTGFATSVSVARITDHLDGPARPGHFGGVATIVSKLLLQALPDRAYFGEKDFQQLQVIRRLARDLDMPVEIVGVPTVREADGLAMSSRNRYLTPEERAQAPALRTALVAARDAWKNGERDPAGARSARRRLSAALVSIAVVVGGGAMANVLPNRFTMKILTEIMGFAVVLFVSGLIAYRKSLLANAFHRGLILLTLSLMVMVFCVRGMAWRLGIEILKYYPIDLLLLAGICAAVSMLFLPRLWLFAPLMMAGSLASALWPQLAPMIANAAYTLSPIGFIYGWYLVSNRAPESSSQPQDASMSQLRALVRSFPSARGPSH